MKGSLLTAIGGAFLTVVGIVFFETDGFSDAALALYVVGGVGFVVAISVFVRELRLERLRHRYGDDRSTGRPASQDWLREQRAEEPPDGS